MGQKMAKWAEFDPNGAKNVDDGSYKRFVN